MQSRQSDSGGTSQRFYHGTKADLKPGDLIEPGYSSNYGKRKQAAYVYLTATLNAATWGAQSVDLLSHFLFHSVIRFFAVFTCAALQCFSVSARADVAAWMGSYSAARWLHT